MDENLILIPALFSAITKSSFSRNRIMVFYPFVNEFEEKNENRQTDAKTEKDEGTRHVNQ